MTVGGVQAEAHGDHRDVGAACLAPGIHLGHKAVNTAPGKRHVVRAEVFYWPAETAHAITEPFPGVDGTGAAAEEDEAIREPGSPLIRGVTGSAKPDRDEPRWLRHECGSVDMVEAAGEIDDRLREELAEQPDLLLLPGVAGTEVLPEGLVLDMVPADSHAQTQPTLGQEVDVGCLPRHERCLALGGRPVAGSAR